MKIRICFLLCIVSVLYCSAAGSSVDKASVFLMQRSKAAQLPHLTEETSFSHLKGIHAFNAADNSGFVITAGDNEDVIAYSTEGNIDFALLPPVLQASLSKASMGICRTPLLERESIAPLVPCRWGQGAPYNRKTISLINSYVTGCTPTALAQVMKYFKYPASGNCVAYYKYEGKTYTYNIQAINFEWDKMLDIYSDYEEYSDEAADAVAELMFCTTLSLPMSHTVMPFFGNNPLYACDAAALSHYFGYDDGMKHLMHSYFDDTTWENIIYFELQQGCPVVFSGYVNDFGHSFICDGYEDGYYHFNWGWDGGANGFYKLETLVMREDPDYSMGYNFGQSITTGICPPGYSRAANPYVPVDPWIRIESDFDKTFTYSLEDWNGFNGEIGVKVVAADNSVKYLKTNDLSVTSRHPQTLKLSTDKIYGLADGSYIVTPVFRRTGGDTWLDMLVPLDKIHYLILDVAGSSYTYSRGTARAEAEVCVTDFVPLEEVRSKEMCNFNITTRNTGNTHFYQGVFINVYPVGSTNTAGRLSTMLVAHHQLPSLTCTHSIYVDVAPGNYEVAFTDMNNKMLSDRFQLTVTGSDGICDIKEPEANIEVCGRIIRVKDARTAVSVSDLSGRICSGHRVAADCMEFNVQQPGMYIVSAGEKALKVAVL